MEGFGLPLCKEGFIARFIYKELKVLACCVREKSDY